jgi:hypothetical protein
MTLELEEIFLIHEDIYNLLMWCFGDLQVEPCQLSVGSVICQRFDSSARLNWKTEAPRHDLASDQALSCVNCGAPGITSFRSKFKFVNFQYFNVKVVPECRTWSCTSKSQFLRESVKVALRYVSKTSLCQLKMAFRCEVLIETGRGQPRDDVFFSPSTQPSTHFLCFLPHPRAIHP